ncbi:hypothetical protein CDIK_1784 [Cucumispora dikerogammari]|nr:hypothetical protein CDIK_1784 [Cucumispora dikerogammari]
MLPLRPILTTLFCDTYTASLNQRLHDISHLNLDSNVPIYNHNICSNASHLPTDSHFKCSGLDTIMNFEHTYSDNNIRQSLLLSETLSESYKNYSVFQTKTFSRYNTMETNLSNNTELQNIIYFQFKEYISDLSVERKNKIYDISFIKTLMYGFIRYLEYNPNKHRRNVTNTFFKDYSEAQVANSANVFDPKLLILSTDYTHIDNKTIKYIEEFMIQQRGIKGPTKFFLYLLELIEVLDRIKSVIYKKENTEATLCETGSVICLEEAECSVYDSSCCVYMREFREAVVDIIELIDYTNETNEEKRLADILEVDVMVLPDETKAFNDNGKVNRDRDVLLCPQFVIRREGIPRESVKPTGFASNMLQSDR